MKKTAFLLMAVSVFTLCFALGATETPATKEEPKKEAAAKEAPIPGVSDEERQDMLDRVEDLQAQIDELRQAKLDEEQELPPQVKAAAEKILSLRKSLIPILEEMIATCKKGDKNGCIAAEKKRSLIDKSIWVAEREREAAELLAEIESSAKSLPAATELKTLQQDAKATCEAYVAAARKQMEMEIEREKLEAKMSRIWKLLELAVQKERVKQMEKELKNGEAAGK